jgi:hypothetical protein
VAATALAVAILPTLAEAKERRILRAEVKLVQNCIPAAGDVPHRS